MKNKINSKNQTPRFILNKGILKKQVKQLQDLGLKVSYSYKTNRLVGRELKKIPECSEVDFSIHSREELGDFSKREIEKVWFFTQAESIDELTEIINKGLKKFVIDNQIDLERILNVVQKTKIKIWLSLRMKFQEHRIGTGKYFVYGMSSEKVNENILSLMEKGKYKKFIEKIGIHIHRKSQNTSEWEIKQELEDSLREEVLKKINFVNLGGGLPIKYRSYTTKVLEYIFSKLKETQEFLKDLGIETYIEPGRFLAGPSIKFETQIIQVYDKNIIINTTVYNCAIDSVLTNTKMLVKDEILSSENAKDKNEDYLIKGNSPTRDDIFRYKVMLQAPRVGDKLTFLNAGAYNYTTDFFGFTKIPTIITE
jgi:ornithine decarboxylase